MATQQLQTEQPKKPASSEQTAIERRETAPLSALREPFPGTALPRPFALMRRLSEDMDRLFEQFFGSSLMAGERIGAMGGSWWPAMDVYQRDNKLIVQADVPGVPRENIKVEVRDNQLFISGERKSETERKERGYYQSERSHGSFTRAIALPEEAKADTASAKFDKGVLEVEIELAPQKAPRGRVIEVREGKSN
jgi:HSP20 family protein